MSRSEQMANGSGGAKLKRKAAPKRPNVDRLRAMALPNVAFALRDGAAAHPGLKEHDVERTISDYLTAEGWVVRPLQAEYGAGGRPTRRTAKEGTADLVAVYRSIAPLVPQHWRTWPLGVKTVFIEVKRPGKDLRDSQVAFAEQMHRAGIAVCVTDDFDEFKKLMEG